jgi:hypothetical protein
MTFSCICVLYPKLVYLLHFSPFYFSSLLMVSSTDIKILYSVFKNSIFILYRKYITHIRWLSLYKLSLFVVIAAPEPLELRSL